MYKSRSHYSVCLTLRAGDVPLSATWILWKHCADYGIHCSREGILYMDMATDISTNASHVSLRYVVALIRVQRAFARASSCAYVQIRASLDVSTAGFRLCLLPPPPSFDIR